MPPAIPAAAPAFPAAPSAGDPATPSPPGPFVLGSRGQGAPGAPTVLPRLGRLLPTDEVGRILGLEPSGVRAAIRRGELPAVRFGRKFLVSESALVSMFEAREAEARARSPAGRLERLRALLPGRRTRPHLPRTLAGPGVRG